MLGVYLGMALICVGSVLLGGAICSVAGRRRWSWLAPATGLAAMIVICTIAIRLPGRGATAAVVLLVLCALAGVLWLLQVIRPRRIEEDEASPGRPLSELALGVAVGAAAVVVASIPFIVNGRVGLLGVAFNNDLAVHLSWVEGLRSASVKELTGVPPGYPLGPHAVVATLASLLGGRSDHAFTALLLSVHVIAALTVLSIGSRRAPVRSGLVALAVAFGYLFAAYAGQGAFKETVQALFVLAFALALEQAARERRWDRAALAPLVLVAAATVYNYSYAGIAWPVATLGLWLGAVALIRVRADGVRGVIARVPAVARVAIPAGLVLLVLLGPELVRIATLFRDVGGSASGSGSITTSNLGNLAGPLSPYEALGAWWQDDLRFTSANAFQAGMLSAVAIGAVLWGLLWSWRSRQLALVAAVVAAGVVFLRLRSGESPYITAKALVILTPLVVALGLRPLISLRRRWPLDDAWVVGAVLPVAFMVVAALSSYHALRGAYVGPDAHRSELAVLRERIVGQPTLFLGQDDFVPWELRGVPVGAPGLATTVRPVALSPDKPWVYGQAFDFDSVTREGLDAFAYAIAPRGAFASAPPPNFRRVATTASYALWKRTGPTPAYAVLPESNGAGGMLDCSKRAGRRLSRQDGTAMVRGAPVYSTPPAPAILPGGATSVTLKLPAGRWDLSLQYTSPQDLHVSAAGVRTTLPANLDRPGPYWAAGTIVSPGGAVVVEIEVEDAPIAAPTHVAYTSSVVATPVGAPRALPLAQACGRYVDRYELAR